MAMKATARQQDILRQIATIQRMERGKLSIIRQGPEGPYYNLQRWQEGRNVTEYVPRDQVPLVEENLEAYRDFEAIDRRVCATGHRGHPRGAQGRGQKKTPDPKILLAREAEIQALIAAFGSSAPSGSRVAELETLVRTAVFRPANELVGWLLQQAADRVDAAYQPKPGEKRKGRCPLEVQGMFGRFTLQRDYYHHPGKRRGHAPADAALGLEGSHTPALARLICLEGAEESSYRKASAHLREVGGIEVGERRIQRVVGRVGEAAADWQKRESLPQPCDATVLYISADATGVPMRRELLKGRKGKAPDGIARTRMAMLGCVFTQHTRDDQGRPLRDHESSSYLAGFQSPSDFGIGLRREAIRRGLGSAGQTVLLIDGAPGLEKLGRDYFPEAIQIVDFYHAMEHLGQLIEILLAKDDARRVRRLHHWKKLLLADGLERIIARARKEAAACGKLQAVESALGYFLNNLERMRYGTFRNLGFFIGSGVIEAGCRSLVGQRCKQSGMFWSEPGAQSILALRCIHASRRLNSFWKDRLNARAALNDRLPLVA